jgi:transposase InsO family protein
MSERLEKKLALDALSMALTERQPQGGLIHHSDRGSQYACTNTNSYSPNTIW